MNILNKIKDVNFYKVNPSGEIYFKDENGNLFIVKDMDISSIGNGVTDDFYLYKDIVNYNSDCYNELHLVDQKINSFEDFYIVNSDPKNSQHAYLVNKNNYSELFLKDLETRQAPVKLTDEYNWDYIYNEHPYYYSIKLEEIGQIKKYEGSQLLWSFDSETLSDDTSIIFKKVIGIYENNLIIACSNHIILLLDKLTGDLKHKWNLSEGNTFESKHQVPNSNKFSLDFDNGYLFYLGFKNFCKINLSSNEIKSFDIHAELLNHNITDLRGSISYGQDEEYIYTIGNMKEDIKSKLTPQCLVAFNKKERNIHRIYQFENDLILTDHPVIFKNRIYIRSGLNNLYIFNNENTENEI